MRAELTSREEEILELIRQGYGNRRIALELGISRGTVKSHLSNAYKSLRVHNRTGAIVAAHRAGYINLQVPLR